MSSLKNEINDENYPPKGNYAPLDSAFEQSPAMQDFKNKLLLRSCHLNENSETKKINSKLDSLIHKSPIDHKMDNSIDEVIGSIYHKEPKPPIPQLPKYRVQLKEGYNGTNHSFWKTIAIIIIIVAIVYLIYQYYLKTKA